MTPGEWLSGRLEDAPAHLRDAMVEAAGRSARANVAEALAEAALALYGRVIAGSGGRADAFPLLAADALLTHAFEAQAELAPDDLGTFAKHWGGEGRLGDLIS
ncbi:MAG TPA: hypothetical protein VMN39_08230 [Longimicrobiaceae bacterium]|nr:hypothetical protein [Longimicrobiaceae bacterium]